MSPAEARAALAAAETTHAAATRAEGAALVALSAAETAFGDNPSDDTERAWREARDARELARLRAAGTGRALERAREQLRAAEEEDTRRRLALALRRADRIALFDALADVIDAAARIDIVPRVDPHDTSVSDDTIAARLAEQGQLAARRGMLSRIIRRAVNEQHQAVKDAREAAKQLGQAVNVAPVVEAQIDALIAIEARALSGQPMDDPWLVPWFCGAFGVLPGVARVQLAHGLGVRPVDTASRVAWARRAVRSGEQVPA